MNLLWYVQISRNIAFHKYLLHKKLFKILKLHINAHTNFAVENTQWTIACNWKYIISFLLFCRFYFWVMLKRFIKSNTNWNCLNFWVLTCICCNCCDHSLSLTRRYFSGLCTSNIPWYFLDFALTIFGLKNILYISE